MPIKVGINGFGRIGRNIVRTAIDDKDIQFVAVNDITDAKTLAHLLKYDSVLGNLPHTITHTDDTISIEGKAIKVFKVKDPAEINWASVGADIVVESTGLFTKGPEAKEAPSGAGEKSDYFGAGGRSGRHVCAGRERQDLRSSEASRDLECFLHHELPGARRQGFARDVWDSQRHDDHDSLVHKRSKAARPAAQGSAPGARRGDQHDSKLDPARQRRCTW